MTAETVRDQRSNNIALLLPALDVQAQNPLTSFAIHGGDSILRIANLPGGDPLIQTACTKNFQLESGTIVPEVRLGFTVYATNLRPNESPADREVIVIHPALTGTARFKVNQSHAGEQGDGWASNWAGSGNNPETGLPYFLDTDRYTVIGLDHFGGRSIDSGTASLGATSARELGSLASEISLRDGVRLAALTFKEQFGIGSVKAVIGGSMGGGQAIEWLFQDEVAVDNIFDISGCGVLQSNARRFFELQARFLREDLPISQNIRLLAEMVKDELPIARHSVGFDQAVQHVVHRFEQLEQGASLQDCEKEAAKLFAVRQLGFLLFVTPEFFEEKRASGVNIGEWLDHQGSRFANRFDSDGLACLCAMIAEAKPLEATRVVDRLRELDSTRLIRSANRGDTLFPAEDQLEFNRDIRIALSETNLFTELYSADARNGHDRFFTAGFLKDEVEFFRLKLEGVM